MSPERVQSGITHERAVAAAGARSDEAGSEQTLWSRFVEAGSADAFCQAWLGLQ